MVTALIPARGGSERIPGKNTRPLAGKPLLAYTIAAARNTSIFDEHIYVSTDSEEIAKEAARLGARSIMRPEQYATAESPDIEWITHAVGCIPAEPDDAQGYLVILRPTNPFRTAATIHRAWASRPINPQYASLRAISPAREHPQKMWRSTGGYISPYQIIHWPMGGLPCDQPTQTLEPIWVQNGCVQITSRYMIEHYGNYTGLMIIGFPTRGHEGLDLNTEDDWLLAETLIERGLAETEPTE